MFSGAEVGLALILLVDDEAALRDLFKRVLEIDHHEVTTAADGNAALAAIRDKMFDLVITDLVMPDKEGIETIMDMKRLQPDLRIIAISGGGRGSAGDYLAMAAQLGAARTLEKPFSNQALLESVREVLAS